MSALALPAHLRDCPSCRHRTHEPEACAQENGCAGCTGCPEHDGDVSTYCVECGHWTVHPDRHEHEDPYAFLGLRDGTPHVRAGKLRRTHHEGEGPVRR